MWKMSGRKTLDFRQMRAHAVRMMMMSGNHMRGVPVRVESFRAPGEGRREWKRRGRWQRESGGRTIYGSLADNFKNVFFLTKLT